MISWEVVTDLEIVGMLEKPEVKIWGAQEEPTRQKRERQKLIVRTKKGERYYGMCFALNKNSPGFHLDLQNKNGLPLNRTQHVLFNDIKAVFYVKSFDGRFNPEEFQPESIPRNKIVAIEFDDGETVLGRPVHATWQEDPRFFVVPEERDSNNIMILVERSAINAIHDVEDYKKQRHQEFSDYVRKNRKPGTSKEECIGDYYFSNRNYKDALRYYRTAKDQDGLTDSLRKKLCASMYNLGMRYIKQKDYPRALKVMDHALDIDPNHDQCLRKAKQLKAHIAKHQSDPVIEEHNPLL